MDLSWLGGLFGSAGNLLGQYMNVGYQKELQENQYKLNQKAYKYSLRQGPKLTRTGLERAGYNPLLATNASMGSGGFSVSPANAPNTSDLGTDAVNAYQNSQRIKNENKSTEATVQNLASQSNQANAQAELNKEQAITEQAKRTQMEFQNAMYDVEKHLKEKELSWADRKFYSEIYDNMQRAENYGAMASVARYNAETDRRNAQTNALNAQSNIMNAQTNASRLPSEEYRNYGQGSASWSSLVRNHFAKNGKKYTNPQLYKSFHKMITSPIGSNSYQSAKAEFFTTLH